MHSETRFVMESFAAGASGYLLKDSGFEEISVALKVVLAGEIHWPDVRGAVVGKRLRIGYGVQSKLPKISSRNGITVSRRGKVHERNRCQSFRER